VSRYIGKSTSGRLFASGQLGWQNNLPTATRRKERPVFQSIIVPMAYPAETLILDLHASPCAKFEMSFYFYFGSSFKYWGI
jgi:hypothetical protein